MSRLVLILVAVGTVIGAIAATHRLAYSIGERSAAARYDRVLDQLRVEAANAVAEAEQAARVKEEEARAALRAASAQHIEEQRDAQSRIDSLVAELHAHRVRLSVATTSCAAASREAGETTGTPTGSGAEARAELVPAVAADLVRIAADGDAAVRQLNRLIDAYNTLRDRYNALAETG